MVATANNRAEKDGIPVTRYPAKFADPNDVYGGDMDNMIVVAASDWKTQRGAFSNYSPFVTTFAPGEDVSCPADPNDHPGHIMKACSGTSFGKSTNGASSLQLVFYSLTNMASAYLCSRPPGRCAGQLLPIRAVSVAVSTR